MEQYLQRMKQAREKKEEINEAIKKTPGSGALWKPKLTIPKPP